MSFDGLPNPCRCRSGLDYEVCCAPAPPARVVPESEFRARDFYERTLATCTDPDGDESASWATLNAAMFTVARYVELRRGNPRWRAYFGYENAYANLVRELHSSEEMPDTASLYARFHAPFDLRVFPSRRAPAAFFLDAHEADLPPDAVKAVRACLRAQDEYCGVARSDGREFLVRLRDGKRRESADPLEPEPRCYRGRLIELAGKFHLWSGGPLPDAALTRWRELEEYAIRWYQRRLAPFPKHTHPRKAILFAGIVLRNIDSVVGSVGPSDLDPRQARRWRDEFLRDPESRREDRSLRRELTRYWCDQPEEAFEDRTPREMVATAEGRRRVEAFLNERERNPFVNRPQLDIAIARRKLGLRQEARRRAPRRER